MTPGQPQKVTVGKLENTAAARLLTKRKIPTKTYDDQVSPYLDLALGRLDAVLLDLPIALYVVKKNPELNPKLQGVGPAIASGNQTCRGSCADLPTAPPNSRSAAATA